MLRIMHPYIRSSHFAKFCMQNNFQIRNNLSKELFNGRRLELCRCLGNGGADRT